MNGRILLAVILLFGMSSVQAGWDVGAGLEHYQWTEYPEGYSGNPRETGPRSALFVNWTQEGEQDVLLAWHAKAYGGTVNYDTFLISTGAPVSTQTEYSGFSHEFQLSLRDNLGGYWVDYLGGIGWDFWRRTIRNTGFNQIEDYSVTFMRAGIRHVKLRNETGWHGELGVKYPFLIKEDAYLTSMGYTSNPQISPKGQVSGYAEIGYRLNETVDLVGYYDSWRFGRSADVMAMDVWGRWWLIHQPRSYMDAVGIKLLLSF